MFVLRPACGPAQLVINGQLDHARHTALEAAGQLRIGFSDTTEGPHLSRLAAAFEARHPGCQVTIQEVPVTEAYAALRADEIDVLIHWLVIDEPDLSPGPAIDRQDRVVAVAVSHPFAPGRIATCLTARSAGSGLRPGYLPTTRASCVWATELAKSPGPFAGEW